MGFLRGNKSPVKNHESLINPMAHLSTNLYLGTTLGREATNRQENKNRWDLDRMALTLKTIVVLRWAMGLASHD